MPVKPPHICPHAGCREIVHGKGYCSKHKGDKTRGYPRGGAAGRKRYDTQRWRKFSRWYLSAHPLCSCGVGARHVDHIKELSDGGEQFDSDNCQALCIACHNCKTAAEKTKRLLRKPTGR